MMSGAFRNAVAILVSGPSGHSVTVPGGALRSVSMMKSTACCGCRAMTGSSICGPSSPVLPCTCSAVTSLRWRGASQPAKTRVSGFPASSQMMRVFFWVSGSGTLPATAVSPRTVRSSGLASASRIATASSCPGSVSMMICRAMDGVLRQCWAQKSRRAVACPWPRWAGAGAPARKGQPSKLISSMIFSAAGRLAAMSIRGSVSGVNGPQPATSAETGTPGFTGNSWLVSA